MPILILKLSHILTLYSHSYLGWKTLVRRLDAWVTAADCFNKFTTFSHGISHYFYVKPTAAKGVGAATSGTGAAATAGQPAARVQFGKVASKQVYRDIFRRAYSYSRTLYLYVFLLIRILICMPILIVT